MTTVEEILKLWERRGHSDYGGEAVTQLEHALQSAWQAEQEQASAELIAAALLHDLGHLLHDLPADAPERGIDDAHENSAGNYLKGVFPPGVWEPIRLHVAAKRYLCAVDPQYQAQLSDPSLVSLNLQGGAMTDEEVESFSSHPFHEDAIRLRRWDDAAKVPNLVTPSLDHFAAYLRQVAEKPKAL